MPTACRGCVAASAAPARASVPSRRTKRTSALLRGSFAGDGGRTAPRCGRRCSLRLLARGGDVRAAAGRGGAKAGLEDDEDDEDTLDEEFEGEIQIDDIVEDDSAGDDPEATGAGPDVTAEDDAGLDEEEDDDEDDEDDEDLEGEVADFDEAVALFGEDEAVDWGAFYESDLVEYVRAAGQDASPGVRRVMYKQITNADGETVELRRSPDEEAKLLGRAFEEMQSRDDFTKLLPDDWEARLNDVQDNLDAAIGGPDLDRRPEGPLSPWQLRARAEKRRMYAKYQAAFDRRRDEVGTYIPTVDLYAKDVRLEGYREEYPKQDWTEDEMWDLITLSGRAVDPRTIEGLALKVQDEHTPTDGAKQLPASGVALETEDFARALGRMVESVGELEGITEGGGVAPTLAEEFEDVEEGGDAEAAGGARRARSS
ncbi:unnamed protein product [Pedinophyceae sp. YPF-701]|nr:unnamed protein product [Pedinophyceae sp. YPF-701]